MFAPEMEKREEILLQSSILFKRHGFKQMTMDDLANHMGISKKTLYKFFRNKKELIDENLKSYIHCENSELNGHQSTSANAIDEMLRVLKHLMDLFDEMDPKLYSDLATYYPEAWSKLDGFLGDHIYKSMHQNIRRGMDEGLYMADTEADILARMYVAKVRAIMQSDYFPVENYSKSALFRVLVEYHIRGIATEKGRQLLSTIKKTYFE